MALKLPPVKWKLQPQCHSFYSFPCSAVIIPWQDTDNSFRGTCDLGVEALSDSIKQERERETKTKFNEYAQTGVPEYYILYAHGEPQQFYRLTPTDIYAPHSAGQTRYY